MSFQLDFAQLRSGQNEARTNGSKLEQLNLHGRSREKFNALSMELLELRFKGRKKFI